jgi:hypothetical protein
MIKLHAVPWRSVQHFLLDPSTRTHKGLGRSEANRLDPCLERSSTTPCYAARMESDRSSTDIKGRAADIAEATSSINKLRAELRARRAGKYFYNSEPSSYVYRTDEVVSSMFVKSPPRGWFGLRTSSGDRRPHIRGPEIDPGRPVDRCRAIHLEHPAR